MGVHRIERKDVVENSKSGKCSSVSLSFRVSAELMNYLTQAWRKYLISGIDKNRCQNRKVSILTSSRAGPY